MRAILSGRNGTWVAMVLMLLGGTGCIYGPESVDAGHEGVQVDQPWFFGTPGVEPQPRATGTHWLWWTSHLVEYDIRPQQFNEKFDDLVTADNVPVDFRAYLLVQLEAGQTPNVHERFGPKWYRTKVQEVFRTALRDFARGQRVFDLTTDPTVTSQGEVAILETIRDYVQEESLPVRINRVVIGGVTPPPVVLEETARTAAQEQRTRTEIARARAELSRADAEKNKALADKAYAEAFGLNPDQFLTYRSLEIQKEMVEVVKTKEKVSVIIGAGGGAATPVVPTGR